MAGPKVISDPEWERLLALAAKVDGLGAFKAAADLHEVTGWLADSILRDAYAAGCRSARDARAANLEATKRLQVLVGVS